jgi:REP element-mobilizing transposase RayT
MDEDAPIRKSARVYEFFRRRRLPHIETCGRVVYLSFATHDRWEIPDAARTMVMDSILYEHNRRLSLVTAIVMPDHVHMLYHCRHDGDGRLYTVAEVSQAIKGASAHRINKALGRRGTVWEQEYFDRIVRSRESLEQKVWYIGFNSVRAGLCDSPEQYPHFWLCWTHDPTMQDME